MGRKMRIRNNKYWPGKKCCKTWCKAQESKTTRAPCKALPCGWSAEGIIRKISINILSYLYTIFLNIVHIYIDTKTWCYTCFNVERRGAPAGGLVKRGARQNLKKSAKIIPYPNYNICVGPVLTWGPSGCKTLSPKWLERRFQSAPGRVSGCGPGAVRD